ncbi:hypothetical protein, unknown function [Leishmania tarentolae]|uniref:Uncharacterized protein n=1 Tax=Leishmania tarentolae TaxID=5689 RepID=A0A640KG26_LEITA|nr:hypothetical protein, unknown function [Leishmania tarentolae]
MDSIPGAPQCGPTLVEVIAVDRGNAAPDAQGRQREGYRTPPHVDSALSPRLCTASVSPVASLASFGDEAPASVAAKMTLGNSSPLRPTKAYPVTESVSSMPSSCGATTETEKRFGDGQSGGATTAVVQPIFKSSPSQPSSLPSTATIVAGGSARRPYSIRTCSMDDAMARPRNVDGPRKMSLRAFTTSPYTLHGSASLHIPGEENMPFEELGSHAESNRTTPLGPLLCCGLPQVHASEEERRASSAENFLTRVPIPQEELTEPLSQTSSPTAAGVTVVPCSVMGTSSDTAEPQTVASPMMPSSGSPTGFATVTAFRSTPHRHSRSFDIPLTFASGVSGSSCDDLSRCYAERRELSTITASIRTNEHLSERLSDTHRQPPLMCPSESTTTLSTLKTSVGGVAVPATAHVNNGGGGIAAFSSNTSTNGGDTEAQLGMGTGLRRTISCDTLASVSSSRSRPVLATVALGPPEASGAVSGTASTTTTSVTYTRKNVCLGAVDFYGNPVTSLSSLLVQMSLRSGDQEEADPSETRLGAASPYPLTQQQQQRNTLSMQNLMVHTQQVGQLAPEDKVKRFHARPDGAGIAMFRGTGTTIPRRCRPCTKPCSTTVAAAASAAPLTAPTVAAAARPQVGSLKDVLRDCNFLSLKDVLSAIADTHVHELREAQQRLSSTHPDGSDGKTVDSSVACEAPALGVVNGLSPSVPSVPLRAEESSVRAVGLSDNAPSVICLGGASSDWACTSSAPEGENGVCLSTSASTDTTCIPALHPSVSSLDAQHVLTLAAAITEASLNLDRSAEASFAGTATAVASSIQPVAVASRAPLSGPESAPAAGISVGEHINSCAQSASFPALLGEAVPAGSKVAPLSTAATPTRRQSAILPCSLISTTHVDVSRRVDAAAPMFTDGVFQTLDYPCDPLERKVLLVHPSNESADGVVQSDMWETPAESSMLAVSPSALRGTGAASPVAATWAAGNRLSAAGSPSAHQRGGPYVANWHGLSSGEELPGKTKASPTVTIVDAKQPPILLQRAETIASAGRSSMYFSTLVEKQETAGVSTVTVDKTSVTKASITAGNTSANASDMRVIVESISFRSFDDELDTVSDLRQWARNIARLEHLKPSTETEVIT